MDGVIATALKENGFTDIRLLLSIRNEDLDDLSYTLDDGTQKVLNKGEQGLIRSFLCFICHYGANWNTIKEHWNLVNVENFNAYCTRNSEELVYRKMVLSCDNAISALTHVITVVMCEETTGAIATALNENGYQDIGRLMSLRPLDLEDLFYTMPGDTRKVCLNKGDQGRVRAFLYFIRYRDEREDSIGDHWNAITAEEFDSYRSSFAFFHDERGDPTGEHWNVITAEETDTYRTSHEFRDINYNLGVETVVATIASTSTTTSSPVDESRVPQAFSTLKIEKQLDTSPHRSTLAQTRLEEIANLLDPSFTTGSDEEEKQSTV